MEPRVWLMACKGFQVVRYYVKVGIEDSRTSVQVFAEATAIRPDRFFVSSSAEILEKEIVGYSESAESVGMRGDRSALIRFLAVSWRAQSVSA